MAVAARLSTSSSPLGMEIDRVHVLRDLLVSGVVAASAFVELRARAIAGRALRRPLQDRHHELGQVGAP